MRIPANQVKDRRKIGHSRGRPVFGVSCIGGLHVVANHNGDIMGAGSHDGLARHIAGEKDPDIQWDDLRKSEATDFGYLLDEYRELTDQLRGEQGL
jgi:hypothetical protein